ncbi:hypothetical protein ACF087_34460 [Streptomyces goshikiensis]|uniref:hypothetical protein n=1 Tax=Streptomyces goshikiensis TaxID=1942 RepID=UPI0036F5D563
MFTRVKPRAAAHALGAVLRYGCEPSAIYETARTRVLTPGADDSRTRATRYTDQDDADAVRPVRRDDQQAHRPPEPGPHRGREAGH